MKKIKETDKAIGGINIIPVIDVCLVLLVILFVLSPVINVESLPVNLPEAMTKESKDQNVTVSLSVDGLISIDSKLVTFDELPSRLSETIQGRENIAVVVRADKDLPYSSVEKLITAVNRHAGKNAVSIATRQRSRQLGMAQP